MSSEVTLHLDIDSEDLAYQIVQDIHDHDEILNFVLSVDSLVADYNFTLQLRDKLTEILKAEDEGIRQIQAAAGTETP